MLAARNYAPPHAAMISELRLDRQLTLHRRDDGGFTWSGRSAAPLPSRDEVVRRARQTLDWVRSDLAVIDHYLAEESTAAKRDLALEKRKRRQDAERLLSEFLGWAARRALR